MSLFILILAAVGSFTSPTAASASSITSSATFAMTLERSASGWSATCSRGCAWSTVGLTCSHECEAIITASGIQSHRSPGLEKEAFAFVVESAGDGVRATSIAGTLWSKVSWTCNAVPCVEQMTESGVSVH